ncbi:MAG: hypothetical protein E6I75_24185 [Chloroflexi bacterium]|nr:MAG: hypothetical protein E6I75_24185 [Chloroflexota bacterium]
MNENDYMNQAIYVVSSHHVVPDLDDQNAEMNEAIRRAAGRPPGDGMDKGDDQLPPPVGLPEGAVDGGARVPAPTEPTDNDVMNAILRRRPLRDQHGHVVGHDDRDDTATYT